MDRIDDRQDCEMCARAEGCDLRAVVGDKLGEDVVDDGGGQEVCAAGEEEGFEEDEDEDEEADAPWGVVVR